QRNVSDDIRLTWQMTPRNKLSGYFSIAPRYTDHWTLVSTLQPDASNLQNLPKNNFETLTFRSTLSSKALFEAAAGNTTETWTREPVEDSVTSRGYPVTERMTINAGLRWDYLNNKVGAQDAPGGTWIGPRHFDELTDVPNYKDLSPRLGIAYDLFGNGKTALKATLSRYVQTSTVGTARSLNPLN